MLKLKLFNRKVIMELAKHNTTQPDVGKISTSTWEKIKDSLTKAGESLRVRKIRRKIHWFNDECQEAIKNE